MRDEFDGLSFVAIVVEHGSEVALSVAEDDCQHLRPPFNRLDRPLSLLWWHHGHGLLLLPPHSLGNAFEAYDDHMERIAGPAKKRQTVPEGTWHHARQYRHRLPHPPRINQTDRRHS